MATYRVPAQSDPIALEPATVITIYVDVVAFDGLLGELAREVSDQADLEGTNTK
jgi:hypothetical protein